MIITAKTLKTIVSKLGKRAKELEELNGKLQNPITVDDIKKLTEYYTQQAKRIKTDTMTLDQCYTFLFVKYRKRYVLANLSKDSVVDEFRLQIYRDDVPPPQGGSVERLDISVKYDIKEDSFDIIEKLLREGK